MSSPAAAAADVAQSPPSIPISSPAAASPPAPSDLKRKLEDAGLDCPDETPLKKQEIDPAPVAVVAETNGSSVDTEITEAETAVAESVSTEIAEVETVVDEPVSIAEVETVVTESVEVTTVVVTETVTETVVGTTEVPTDGTVTVDGEGGEAEIKEAAVEGNGQHDESGMVENFGDGATVLRTMGELAVPIMRKIEIPNNKVGVLIGKAGETIKNLQFSSGAKIQITRDTEADPQSSTRPVELTGTPENIDKAERLIKDVISEADAGGSPALVAKGFGTVQSGSEYIELPVPNEKVGMIIGKGGETIKNLQAKSGARVQLIPQHLPAGDTSTERVVRISGHKSQIESAKELVLEVMNKVPRPSNLSGKYNQQSYHPRGPSTPTQWGPRAAAPTQQMPGYDHPQRGGQYSSQTTQHPQAYNGYPQQHPQRSNTAQRTGQNGGYDYYNQGPAAGSHPPNSMSTPVPGSASAPVNYNYGPTQAPGYGQPPSYAQYAPTQQNYGAPPNQQSYAPQSGSQPGGYSQQQPYGGPVYGNSAQEAPQNYGPPRASHPGDPMYQGQVPPYGQTGQPQQSYPYASSAPSQPSAYGQPYAPAPGAVDGYAQPSSAYPQQGQVAPGYAQGGQPVPTYTQPGPQPGGYVQQYPQSQPGYGDQSAQNNVNYGYQGGPSDPGYGNNPQIQGYPTAMPAGQTVYAQQPQPGYYEQPAPAQSGQGTMPASGPQPGYGAQVYGQPQA